MDGSLTVARNGCSLGEELLFAPTDPLGLCVTHLLQGVVTPNCNVPPLCGILPFTVPLVTFIEQVGAVKPSCSTLILQKPERFVDGSLTVARNGCSLGEELLFAPTDPLGLCVTHLLQGVVTPNCNVPPLCGILPFTVPLITLIEQVGGVGGIKIPGDTN